MTEFETAGETELEARLRADRPVQRPQLRDRILACVARELAAERRRGWWTFAAGLAATVLFGLNLSLSAGRSCPPAAPTAITAAELEAACRQIEPAVPGMSAADIRRELLLARAGGRLPMLPKVSGPVAPAMDRSAVPD